MRVLIAAALLGAIIGSSLGAFAAPRSGLIAGTAAGARGVFSRDYALGTHYPAGVPFVAALPAGTPPAVFNHTAPRNEWPDPARVPGKRPAMSLEIRILGAGGGKK